MATTEVPLTIVASPATNFLSVVAIGNQKYYPPSVTDNSYWFSVYDRSSLQQVFSQVQANDADSVPADLSGKFNTAQYFLVVATRSLMSAYVPAGKLHAFLVDNGASVALKRLTQVYQQLGCGSLGTVTYLMAGVLGPGMPSHPPVEASAMAVAGSLFYEATLLGVPLSNSTLYSPVPLTLPTP
jgi:hypothetical protein